MSKLSKLGSYRRPEANVIFRKSFDATDSRGAFVWLATRENNGHLVWRGHCLDSKPWEESDWIYEIVSFYWDRDAAIEACCLSAVAEREEQPCPAQ